MTITVQTFDRLDDAAAALASEPSARFFGGGTLLMRAVNEGDPSISTLLRTTDSGFRQIRPTGGRIEIGGGVTMADILAAHELAFLHPAARAVGGPAVRNMASVGGNLFAPAPYGDLATALLALDATVTLAGGHSGRETPLEEVIANRDRGRTGIVASVSAVRPATADAFRFLKVSRVKPGRLPVITIAAHLPLSGGRVQGARVAYGAMAPTPIRVPPVERALEGRALEETDISAAVAVAADGLTLPTDAIATEWYRREVAPVHLRRLLLGQRL